MKKLLLQSSLLLGVLCASVPAVAQEYVNFDMYGFMTKSDVSYDTPQAQQYVVSKMVYTVDSTSPYYIQKQTPIFNSNAQIDNSWVKVTSCYVRNGVMYGVRYSNGYDFSRISSFDSKGTETLYMDVPATNGYITQAAYVADEDLLYMVISKPTASKADLYRAPGHNPADMTFVATIADDFMEKPFSFAYVPEKDLFFYVTNEATLYSISRTGEKEYYYGLYPSDPYMPSDGSDGTTRYMEQGSALVWSAPYEMLIWCCPRGATSGGSFTYWYGLELIKGSETPVVHNLVNHKDSGLTNNFYNCMTSEGITLMGGVPLAPPYASVYKTNGKPGYYDASWPAVRTDIDGNELEGTVSYNVYIGDNLLAKVKQPVKGNTVGLRFLLPHAWTEDTFYIGIQTVAESGTSSIKVEGPYASVWDPNDPGHWYQETPDAVNDVEALDGVTVSGNQVTFSGLSGAAAQIISVDGKIIRIVNGDSTIELPTGIYLVRTADKTIKIAVK